MGDRVATHQCPTRKIFGAPNKIIWRRHSSLQVYRKYDLFKKYIQFTNYTYCVVCLVCTDKYLPCMDNKQNYLISLRTVDYIFKIIKNNEHSLKTKLSYFKRSYII